MGPTSRGSASADLLGPRASGEAPAVLARLLVLISLLAIPCSAAAQLRSALYGVELPAGHDSAAVTVAIESAAAGAGLTPARDAMLDAAPADAMLLSYVQARSDAVALVVRVRPRTTPSNYAIRSEGDHADHRRARLLSRDRRARAVPTRRVGGRRGS